MTTKGLNQQHGWDDSGGFALSAEQDLEQRELALDIRQSFCVSAPAGSGKTELLTQRFLKLLADVDEPEKVLAITFTRKAAAEMRDRLLAALYQARNLYAQPNHAELFDQIEAHRKQTLLFAKSVLQKDQALKWHLLDNPNRLRIQTIDSLCNAIAVGEPVASRLGGALSPVDDAANLYATAVDSFLAQIKTFDPEDTNLPLRVLLDYFYGQQYLVKELLMAMLPVREQWLPYVGEIIAYQSSEQDDLLWQSLEQSLRQYIEERLVELKSVLQPYVGTITELVEHALSYLRKTDFADCKAKSMMLSLSLTESGDLPKASSDNLKSWLAILEMFFVAAGTARKSVSKDIGFPADAVFKGEEKQLNKARKTLLKETALELYSLQGLPALVDRIRALPITSYTGQTKKILLALSHCLRSLCAHLNVVFAEAGQCDHVEIQAAALRALGAERDGQPTELGLQWHRKIQHLLVDEFQDTSVSQFRLIEALTSEWNAAQGEINQRSLMVVGDGMQSIYAFRQAQVGLFLRAREYGIGTVPLTALQLSQNFRSSYAIVNWVNQQFSRSFPLSADWSRGAVSYSPSLAAKGVVAEGLKHVSFAAVVDDREENDSKVGVDELERLEAEKIVESIREFRQLKPQGTVAVLVRSKKHAQPVINALERHSLIWQGVEMYPLQQREVVVDAMTLLRASTNPADSVAWWAVLRAPWTGLLLSDMQRLHNYIKESLEYSALSDWLLCSKTLEKLENQDNRYIELSEDARIRLKYLVSQLQKYWVGRSRLPLRQEITTLWRALGADLLAERSVIGDDSVSAEAFFALLEQLDAEQSTGGDSVTVELINQKLQKLFAESNAGRDEIAPVQLMTIHKSKGLEFDMVVLPALNRRSGRTDFPVMASRELVFQSGNQGIALSPKPPGHILKPGSTTPSSNSIYEFLREETKQAETFESDRLFYVASTRAKERLLLTAGMNWDPDQQRAKPPGKGSLLFPHWQNLLETGQVEYIKCSELANKLKKTDSADFRQIPLRRFSSGFYSQAETAYFVSASDPRNPVAEKPKIDDQLLFELAAPDEDSENILQRAAGVLFHDLMERWHLRQQADAAIEWPGADQTMDRYLAWRLNELTLENGWLFSADQKLSVCQLVSTACERVRGSDTFIWLFDSSHRYSTSEFALNYVEQHDSADGSGSAGSLPLQQIRIDRTFIDSENRRWIIDFKLTQSFEEGAAKKLEHASLKRLLEQYRPQLEKYRQAMEHYDRINGQTPSSVHCALFLPLTDQLLEC